MNQKLYFVLSVFAQAAAATRASYKPATA